MSTCHTKRLSQITTNTTITAIELITTVAIATRTNDRKYGKNNSTRNMTNTLCTSTFANAIAVVTVRWSLQDMSQLMHQIAHFFVNIRKRDDKKRPSWTAEESPFTPKKCRSLGRNPTGPDMETPPHSKNEA